LLLLAQGLGSVKRWLNQKLRDVRPLDIAITLEEPSAKQILWRYREGVLIIPLRPDSLFMSLTA
jgi:hypothetical protein